MKKTLLIAISTLIFLPAFSQYKIDLNKVEPAQVKYLKLGNSGPAGKEIKVNNLYMEEGGVPLLPVMGEFHYSRMDERYWKDALLKMKSSGVNIVATYVLWMLHEEIEGRQIWTGNRNLRKFVELCGEVGLKVHLRIGPYCNAEIRNGALPDWIVYNKSFRSRTNDPLYLEYTRNWYKSVYRQVEGLLYKDNGPIMAIQLENEYVMPGIIVSHLMNLKQMAVETGFDVPVYSMTHWMDSDYPKGEIIPYAGFYIETPWITMGRDIGPPTSFEFFTFNRLSDNIGTDIIKIEGDIESFDGSKNDSPFFTCEVGVGTPTSYKRRSVVPEEMAGENINLRLGCGANLMGYYMYVGGTNPVGEKDIFGSNPAFGYDYQAPIREFGSLGIVMKETKKLNYFMNDFGTDLAPKVAYLPTSNKNRDNLQWAVRTDGKSGYLFCSNYLYKHDRKDYKKVQFQLSLKDETLKIPHQSTTVYNKAYFLWPFNLDMNGVTLKYATVQPVCTHNANNIASYFFFADDGIPAEYLIKEENVQDIQVDGGNYKKEKGQYFIDGLIPGKECVISITKNDGKQIRIITLTEEESDYIWKGKTRDNEFVAITQSILTYEGEKIKLSSESPRQEAWLYNPASRPAFVRKQFDNKAYPHLKAGMRLIPPMEKADWITSQSGTSVQRIFDGESLSSVNNVTIRFVAEGNAKCIFNEKEVISRKMGDYMIADLTGLYKSGNNTVKFELSQPNNSVIGEIEVLLKNGTRFIWNTDNTWLSGNTNVPVKTNINMSKPKAYASDEHLAVYEIETENLQDSHEETRLYINFVGNIASAYIGQQQVNDHYYDGSEWILGLSRYQHLLAANPLIIRIKGFESMDEEIYLEKFASQSEGMTPRIIDTKITQEYHNFFK